MWGGCQAGFAMHGHLGDYSSLCPFWLGAKPTPNLREFGPADHHLILKVSQLTILPTLVAPHTEECWKEYKIFLQNWWTSCRVLSTQQLSESKSPVGTSDNRGILTRQQRCQEEKIKTTHQALENAPSPFLHPCGRWTDYPPPPIQHFDPGSKPSPPRPPEPHRCPSRMWQGWGAALGGSRSVFHCHHHGTLISGLNAPHAFAPLLSTCMYTQAIFSGPD